MKKKVLMALGITRMYPKHKILSCVFGNLESKFVLCCDVLVNCHSVLVYLSGCLYNSFGDPTSDFVCLARRKAFISSECVPDSVCSIVTKTMMMALSDNFWVSKADVLLVRLVVHPSISDDVVKLIELRISEVLDDIGVQYSTCVSLKNCLDADKGISYNDARDESSSGQ